MTIHTPGRRLMHAVPLKFVQKHASLAEVAVRSTPASPSPA